MIEPAVSGARNVITAAADAGGVRRVVMTSSIGAVYMGGGGGEEVDETCWSDLDHCRDTGNWYCYAKTVAEQAAWELAKERRLDLVVVNPSLVLGPLLQRGVNASTWHVLKYLDGSARTYADAAQAYVHVRDVADAHARAYESPPRAAATSAPAARCTAARCAASWPPSSRGTRCPPGARATPARRPRGAGSAAASWRSSVSPSCRRASACTTPSSASRTRACFPSSLPPPCRELAIAGAPLLFYIPLRPADDDHGDVSPPAGLRAYVPVCSSEDQKLYNCISPKGRSFSEHL